MPYTLEWRQDGAMVVVRNFGDVQAGDIRHALSDIDRETTTNELPLLLIDVRNTRGLPSRGELVLFLEKSYRLPRVSNRMAVIFDERTADAVDFLVLAATNRSIPVAKFPDEEAALRWLLES